MLTEQEASLVMVMLILEAFIIRIEAELNPHKLVQEKYHPQFTVLVCSCGTTIKKEGVEHRTQAVEAFGNHKHKEI